MIDQLPKCCKFSMPNEAYEGFPVDICAYVSKKNIGYLYCRGTEEEMRNCPLWSKA
jgi:hypothetical protein